ncbi:hypothetical protein PR371_03510 [Mycobacterium marinum]|uniref:hypothetical protein n=1 Tax=Mycobacterium marinum TaxID=1781 RepID=UPI00234174B7|nr:hypothetical protein [Mycobacterium marinum]MDC8993042.1 hypothetical protein [Mycobacterium marinum]WDZ12890.1 hypothetical protein PQR73_019905 [Mycobacterium marinum]
MPILVATAALALVGPPVFPSYQPEFNDRDHLPAATPVDESYEAAARHFSPNRLNPDILTAATIRTNTRSRNMLSPLATDSNSRGRSPSPRHALVCDDGICNAPAPQNDRTQSPARNSLSTYFVQIADELT